MIRTLLIATTLLTASGAALAHNDIAYGRVIEVEPRVSFSFGTGYHDGFRVLYESGGSRYWTYAPYRPGPTIVLPPHHHRMKHLHHYRAYDRGWDERRGWDDRRGWDERRGWDDGDRRGHRRHGRD